MAAALTLLLIGSLLQGAQSKRFKAFVLQTIEVLRGSCVTIPCSFEIEDKHESNLDDTCRAQWFNDDTLVFDSKDPQTRLNNGELTGDLTKKTCTTTLNNIQPAGSNEYGFRLECDNKLKYSFKQTITISVTDVPPRPTLTPSALKVEEGASVSLRCSAPAPCLSHPPTVTWTKGLGDIVETLQENKDRTKVLTSVVTFTASHKHHGETISCEASYHKQDGSAESAATLTADVSYAAQILLSSDCITAGDQLNCSCWTLGNPPPTVRWYLNGSPVNHSEELSVSSARLNDTTTRSIITVNRQQEAGLSSLLCRSVNSRGSATQRFCVGSSEPQTTAGSPGRFTLTFIVTVVALTAALMCALLFAIGAHRTRGLNSGESQYTGDTSSAVASQGLAGEKLIELSVTAEEAIYANTNLTPNMPNTRVGDQQVARRSPEEKPDEDGSDVLYSSVTFKSKSQIKEGERSGGRSPSPCSYLEEERRMEGGAARGHVVNASELGSLYDKIGMRNVATKTINTEYAQVNL
ncbi:sialic acid-binding Ig-like lectin 14 isoform X2 [Gasterosteus aculeatus]